MLILIVAGEKESTAGLSVLLSEAGHQPAACMAAELPRRELEGVGLVIIARGVGHEAALELVRGLRAKSATLPILVSTAQGLVEERVRALEAGADDALETPFAPSQMVARVSSLERRARLVPKPPAILEADGCYIDLDRGRAARGGEAVELSRREVEIVRWLHRHRGRAVSRRELLEHVFGVSPEVETRSVDMAIAVLRRKLERDPRAPRIIVSRIGVGYAWEDLTET